MTSEQSTADYIRLLDPAVRPDPYPLFARLRERGPFRIGTAPVVVVTGHADCTAVLRDPRVSVDRSLAKLQLGFMPIYDATKTTAEQVKPSFLFLDPPDHTRLRRLVSKAFTPRVVQRLEPRITEIVDDILDKYSAAGTFDAVTDFAYPLPVTVICELLGVPLEDEAQLSHWSSLLSRTLDPTSRQAPESRADPAELERAGTELSVYFERLTERRRADPGPDLLSQLIAAEDAGDMLTHDELISTCALLLVAGHETTVNLIANATLALLRRPAELAALRANPERAQGVVEETLRFDSPVQLMPRIAADDLTVGGISVDRGDLVVMLIAAAHRDPAVFPDPDRFDPARDNRHLAFGLGAHFCLGAPLARLEARVALTRFAQRVEVPRLTTDPPVYREHVNLRGPAHMPVEFAAVLPR
ncbi:cytochrome P450 [Nocardia tenerifensis]|uniref:Cytochrome P450 n=1 Tax=Nocardia tenerifensis TaxID=228006 RepID=A0A318JXA7_9NOCA|nr:cytochrome P450 [Nocardia tenerifensis]PXX61588.1 cytochrome P450 [Nocardia tenerifensis]